MSKDADLYRTTLSNANLSGANLSDAKLYKADLSSAWLCDANLIKANLYKADLSRAKLIDAKLIDANLRDANLERTDLSEVLRLNIEQLSEVKTLYKAELDPELMEQVKDKYPHLLEEPKSEE